MKTRKIFIVLLLVVILAFVIPATALALAPNSHIAKVITIPPLNAISLGVIVASLFSLVFDYAPGVAAKFEKLTVPQKQLVAGIVAFLITLTIFILTCYGIISSNLICTTDGAYEVLVNTLYVFALGQGFHAGTKPTYDYKFDKNIVSF